METIWKFEIEPKDGPIIEVMMPKGAEILSTGSIGDSVFVWAKFNMEQTLESEPRYFEVFGTGHNIPVDMGIDRNFIGTTFMYGGSLVWHIFERIN
jgi:hypothetical protein